MPEYRPNGKVINGSLGQPAWLMFRFELIECLGKWTMKNGSITSRALFSSRRSALHQEMPRCELACGRTASSNGHAAPKQEMDRTSLMGWICTIHG